MEINGNNLSEPVKFYTKNTENLIKKNIESNELTQTPNFFLGEFDIKEKNKLSTTPIKKRKRSKRLNVIDSEFLPDEENDTIKKQEVNIFTPQEKKGVGKRLEKIKTFILTKVPLINYVFLRNKSKNIKNTVEKLNGINQNIDELIGTSIPYGEDNKHYDDIANNLSSAATIISKTKKINNY